MLTKAPTEADSPWHAGEIALQQQAGVAVRMDEIGRRVLRDHLIDQHRAFYTQLPFVVLGTVDDAGNAWASLRAGQPGFLQSPVPHSLCVTLGRAPDDPADMGMEDGQAIGLLGSELQTRRRNRLNGTIRRKGPDHFEIEVGQSYGNCPRYIQPRDFAFTRAPSMPSSAGPAWLDHLDPPARRLIGEADTFFVASYTDPEQKGRQVVVSHRGGAPGFVRIGEDGALTIPDFAGNLFFNTLGNILINGRAGLVFADFETGELLQLSGVAEVLPEGAEVASFPGAERLWRFTPRHIVRRPDALPLRMHALPARHR
jgi:predicted pyridoxine 5'-phosphate oxidase superfamily flavin-nucleotide-binding protein